MLYKLLALENKQMVLHFLMSFFSSLLILILAQFLKEKQEIRKAQDLALCQGARPETETCEGGPSTNFAVEFLKDEANNYVKLYVDKDTEDTCDIEDKYFSPTIKILDIDPISGNSGWVSFYREDLNVRINDSDTYSQITIDFCIKSACTEDNTSSITVNNKGMVEIQ